MALFILNLVKKLYRIGGHQTSSNNGQCNDPETQDTVSYSVTEECVLFPNNSATQNEFSSSSSRKAQDNSQSLLGCEHLTDILWIDCDNSSDLDAVEGKTNNERLPEMIGPTEREKFCQSVRIEFPETELRSTSKKPFKTTANECIQRNADIDKSKPNNYSVKPCFVNKDDNCLGLGDSQEPLFQQRIIKAGKSVLPQSVGVVRHQTLISDETELNRDEICHEHLSDYCTIDKVDKTVQNVAEELSDSRKTSCGKLTDTYPTYEKHGVACLNNSMENSFKLDKIAPDEEYRKITYDCQKLESEESFGDKLSSPKEQVTVVPTLEKFKVKDWVHKPVQDGSREMNIEIHNTDKPEAFKKRGATKGRIKRRELLRRSGANILRQDRRPSEVAALTESTFSAIYQPFCSIKTQLVRQARDILLCQFLGDFKKFQQDFLLPAGSLLQKIQYKHP
ncbi:uncharacterized protein LOC143239616 isoform X2 [Tachypleus tridentatus]|uniref:uncharacterized protein LOC143239616 isoform X2 n=1 Tax=Tachypleus tridentatus TaxID=6853 RepID=UPI003FD519E3